MKISISNFQLLLICLVFESELNIFVFHNLLDESKCSIKIAIEIYRNFHRFFVVISFQNVQSGQFDLTAQNKALKKRLNQAQKSTEMNPNESYQIQLNYEKMAIINTRSLCAAMHSQTIKSILFP